MTALQPFLPTLALLGFYLGIARLLPRSRTWARVLVIGVALAVWARYLVWRFTETRPVGQPGGTWFVVVLVIEVCAFLSCSLFCLTVSRTADRTAEADRWEAWLRSLPPEEVPEVDVFLPTYNEPLDVVERSIVAALALDYPRFTVWVLDDGKRDWLRDFCAAKGANYVRRPDNKHAKAGNLNHALALTKAPLVAILDADFAARSNFLYRTVGLFYSDRRVAVVQTPQHFFNPDTFQFNLGTAGTLVDNEREWYDTIQPSRDAWDCAFCCGSCCVLRRDALLAVGGMPTESITEDILLTMKQYRHGWITRYLNERLCTGLLPETLKAMLIQRRRWAHGHIQTLFLKTGPLGPGLTLLQRLLFFPVDYFTSFFVCVGLAFVVPLVYLFTGLPPFRFTSTADLVSYLVPMLLGAALMLRWITPRTRVSWFTVATHAYLSFRLFPTILGSLIKPFGTPFRVTPKGSGNSRTSADRPAFWAAVLAAALTIVGLAAHRLFSGQAADGLSPVACVLMLNNLIILGLIALFVVERPRPRQQERFAVKERACWSASGTVLTCQVVDLSLSGARVEGGPRAAVGETLDLALEGVGRLPGRVVRHADDRVGVTWLDVPEATRDRLIRYLYASERTNAPGTLRPWRAFRDVLKWAFGSSS